MRMNNREDNLFSLVMLSLTHSSFQRYGTYYTQSHSHSNSKAKINISGSTTSPFCLFSFLLIFPTTLQPFLGFILFFYFLLITSSEEDQLIPFHLLFKMNYNNKKKYKYKFLIIMIIVITIKWNIKSTVMCIKEKTIMKLDE